MNKLKKAFLCLLAFCLILQECILPVSAASKQYRKNVKIYVDGTEVCTIPGFDDDYDNNLYISLKGVAYALKGTTKAFKPSIDKKGIELSTGVDSWNTAALWTQSEMSGTVSLTSAKNLFFIDDVEKKYYSFLIQKDGGYDAFLTPISIAMMFDMQIHVYDGYIEMNTGTGFDVTPKEMEESGYLQGVNALLVGDGTTGRVYYHYKSDTVFAIASTTKLMSFMIIMDAIDNKECSLYDTVTISQNASKLSKSADGVIKMEAGTRVPFEELIYAMLLPSSNESVLAMAEHICGSEEKFVKRMNDKARDLGMENALFYNCHGLPHYEDNVIPAKVQNRMTAEEMFLLASTLTNEYPQILKYTSTILYHMDTFDKDIYNTNALIYNVYGAKGLKTGTTNKAGACLVGTIPVVKEGKTHYMITVLLGAEGDANRGTVSEVALRYASKVLFGKEEQESITEPVLPEKEDTSIPTDPEKVVRKLIQLKGNS